MPIQNESTGLTFPTGLIIPWPESVSHHTASFSVLRIPEPVLLRLVANEAPQLIKFTDKGNISVS
uniref:Iso-IS1 insB n=1 Tax=Escherichia coli TaxID=562 RepID=Q6YGS7_ECOLX|nr:Iso-IS1 insB [Escherichia coli]